MKINNVHTHCELNTLTARSDDVYATEGGLSDFTGGDGGGGKLN